MRKGKKAFSDRKENCSTNSHRIPEDKEVLAALHAGGRKKEKMLYCLFEEYNNVLSGIGRNLNVNKADYEELFNDVFLDLIKVANNPDLELDSLKKWIIGVFKNKAMKKFSKEEISRKDKISLEDVNLDQNDNSLNEEAIERIISIMDQLDEECRELLILRYLQADGLSLSYEQIARKTGESESVIKRKVPCCIEKIKKFLGFNKRGK